MAHDDWRIRISLEPEHREGFLERLGLGVRSPADELARELEGRRLAVSHDGDDVFVYAASPSEAERARAIVKVELADEGLAVEPGPVERWLHDEERWDHEPPGPTTDEELIAEGVAPWEVRVECESRADAQELEEELRAEGRGVARRFRYLIVGADSEEDAEALAARLHGRAGPSGRLVYETMPQNPFVVFGGLGGTGTPL